MRINGLKVVDLKRKIALHITPNDVAKGATKDPGACAAALCIKREVPGCVKAKVHLGRTYIQVGDKWLRGITSKPLRTEIVTFDRGGTFEPGVYIIAPVQKSQLLGKKTWKSSDVGRQNPKHKQKKRMAPHTVTGVRQHGANR